jgi:DNA primase
MPRLPISVLRRLRNDIPIDFLILSVLKIPAKSSEGFLRFLCPFCSEFNSAINPKTNLARCFRCNKNFNPIDLVIADKGLPFRDAVQTLLPFLPSTKDQEPP